MTRVFIADVSKLNRDIEAYRNYISQYRYEKAKRYKYTDDCMLSIGAELLLANYLGRKPCYEFDEYQKPIGEEVQFNFSHSGSIAVCAVSDNSVGVDVEKIRKVNIDIAKNKFCNSEYKKIMNSENPNETFFEYWVKKESYLKALGIGLRIPLMEFDVDEINNWQFYSHEISGYKICACAMDKVFFEEKNPIPLG